MPTYDFTLILDADDIETIADPLFEAGCDDATLSRICGDTRLSFDREAESFEVAVNSAIRDVQSTGLEVLGVLWPPRKELPNLSAWK